MEIKVFMVGPRRFLRSLGMDECFSSSRWNAGAANSGVTLLVRPARHAAELPAVPLDERENRKRLAGMDAGLDSNRFLSRTFSISHSSGSSNDRLHILK